jgi:hypothetical protein
MVSVIQPWDCVTANVARNVLPGRSRAQTRDESFATHSLQVVSIETPEGELLREAERAVSGLEPPDSARARASGT